MAIDSLIELMTKLRDPESGCPWDKKQSYQSLMPYTLEEVYEVFEAIDNKDWQGLKLELGDLLFQVVFYSQIAAEEQRFNFNDVVDAVVEKMTRRHPHVFAGKTYKDDQAIDKAWQQIKESEKNTNKALAGITKTLPALKYAQKMQKRASRVGFDWQSIKPVYDKLYEEIDEVKEALASGDKQQIEDEMGDVLFAAVNLSRHLNVDAEEALRQSSRKFGKRFDWVEQQVNIQNKDLKQQTEKELLEFWQKAKEALD